LLCCGSVVPLRSPCPTVLEAGNALPFAATFWQVVSQEPVRLQMEEHARWALLRASLRVATRVLVPTRAMRQAVITRLPDLIDRVDIALWGVAPIFQQLHWADPPGEAVLGVSKHGIN